MTSQTPNKDLMAQSRALLVGKWGTVALATLVYFIAAVALQLISKYIPFIGFLVVLAVSGPLALGYVTYMLSFARGGTPDIPVIFSGFNNFVKAMCVYLLMMVIIIVGFVLLIVPGIIASLALAMCWFVMLDKPELGVVDVLKESYDLMQNNKWKLFCLVLRFLGWIILSIITIGIGFLFVIPYMQIAFIKFYEEIKAAPAQPAAAPAPAPTATPAQ
jgi:uncharacterized membrane protein